MSRAPSWGRRKIELKLIEDERERAISLSKHYVGLFKKAGELATLCGANIAIILFTLNGKPLSFGSPSVTDVLSKFLGSDHVEEEPNLIKKSIDSFRKAKIKELNHEFNVINEKLLIDHKHSQSLEANLKSFLGGKSYEDYKSKFGVEELMWIKYKLEEMKRDLQKSFDVENGSCSFNYEPGVDLSKVEAPKDLLKL